MINYSKEWAKVSFIGPVVWSSKIDTGKTSLEISLDGFLILSRSMETAVSAILFSELSAILVKGGRYV